MLCNKNECTGCFSCFNACPKGAIEMEEDKCGFIYPTINEDKCINCKLCEKVCPVLNKIELNKPKKCYAGRVKDSRDLKKATSGGIATQLSKKILEEDGVVYRASFTSNCEVSHIRVDNEYELDKLRGSKYVHSYVNNTYKLVKKDLNDGKKVLFVGTPCQIAGLKKYLLKEYSNLYTVDVICHGVPSQQFLKDEVKRLEKNINIDRVNFRDKKFEEYTFSIIKNNKEYFHENWSKSPYFYSFMVSIIYRENCYNCRYATDKRCSDLTIGDFWGLKEDSTFYKDRKKGVSVLLPCTDKGIELIKSIQNDIELEERDVNEAIEGNDQLRRPAIQSKKARNFRNNYNGDFYKTYKKVMKLHYYKQKLKSNKFIGKILEIRKGIRNEYK